MLGISTSEWRCAPGAPRRKLWASIVTRSTNLLVDVDTTFTAGYGDMLSWAVGEGPGLGERPVLVVQDVDVAKFEKLTLDLLSNPSRAS